MFTQANLFLVLLLVIALIAKNNSLIVAVSVLIAIKLIGLDQKIFPVLQSKGINWGSPLLPLQFWSRLQQVTLDLSSLEKR